ncbi:MAG TPA: S9 family peptidase [Pyrinomonadaceae bacterium]|nr:S9 family peptidase [Pyrinomonadaceae bacterium]
MRKLLPLLCCLAVLAGAASGQKQTPAPEDVPQPVPGDLGLAGARCPDIARYLNVRAATAPSLSPDGARVAYRTSTTGQPQIWVAETRAGAAPRQITFGEPVTFHEWSPDGQWIAYGVDRAGNEREGFYLISPDGTREVELLPPSQAFRAWGAFSRDGRYVAFAATDPGGDDFHIYTLNLKAEELRPLRVYSGSGGNYVAAWRPDRTGILISRTRGEDANDVLYLDMTKDEVVTLFRPEVAARYDSFAWTPDARGFYMATDQDRDFAGLAFYDMTTRKLTWVETPKHDVEQVALSSDGRYLAWTENVGGFSKLKLRTVQGQALPLEGHAFEVTSLGVISQLGWAARAPKLAFWETGPGLPGDVWTLDAAGWPPTGTLRLGQLEKDMRRRWTRVTESSLAGLDPAKFVAPQAVSFKSHDGETVHGLLYLPAGASAETRPPVILAVHGGPSAQARPSFSAVQQYLLARGYAVFDLNFRGSTGYGKRYARLDNGRLRPNAVKDMAAAVDWLKSSGHPVDASKTAVMGGSYGGYMTFAALTQLPDKFKAGVSFVGVSNWVTALEGASPSLKASDRIEYGNIEDPADREFFRQLSPLTHVAGVRAPLLVSHGANDPRDPITESDQFVRAIRERGGEVEYLRFPDEGHGIRRLSNRVIAYRRVARFLERTLGPGTVTCPKPEEQ